MIEHLRRQKEWSLKTFGDGFRLDGVIDHIKKELIEIKDCPQDVEEWADLIILALDGAWRSGATPEAIAAAIEMKQKKNEGRDWPDHRNYSKDEAIQHIKEVPEGVYKRGEIIRYSDGATALIRVDSVQLDRFGGDEHRYSGRHCMGGTHFAYHNKCALASEQDVNEFRKHL